MHSKLEQAATLARKYELLLVQKGYHIALSGSALYGDAAGRHEKDDFDFHTYPHVFNGKIADEEPETILSWLPITINKHGDRGDDYCHVQLEVFVCRDNDTQQRVDFFFWNI